MSKTHRPHAGDDSRGERRSLQRLERCLGERLRGLNGLDVLDVQHRNRISRRLGRLGPSRVERLGADLSCNTSYEDDKDNGRR